MGSAGRIFLAFLGVVAIGGLLAVGATARGTSAGSPAPAAFRLADGSAGCAFDGTTISCRGRSTGTVVMDAEGRTHASSDEVEWNASTPVLLRTESWWNGPFGCRVDDATIVCTTVDGGMLAVDERGIGGGHAANATLP